MMKKILLLFIAFILSFSTCKATENEEVILEFTDTDTYVADIEEENVIKEKTLKEKIRDIYSLEIEHTDRPAFLLSEILTKKYDEKSIMESTHLWGAYSANLGLNFAENESFNGNYSYDYINIGLDGKLKDNNADFRIMLNYNPLSNRNFAQNLFSDMYIATNKIPHNRIWLGNTRPRVGMEGGYSPFLLPFVSRAQISRNYGTVRRLGARLSGDYRLVDYDLGIYSSDTYWQSFFPGTEFIGWVNFKPLGMTDGKYGELTIGSGVQTGKRTCNYTVAGAYVGYKYKKWWANFEWADADGYNGPSGNSVNTKSSGYYSTLAYSISPKLQALVRYDQFDPNKQAARNNRREYVAGINYFIKGQAVKMMLNYVYCENKATKNSHRIVLGTQILL